MNRFVIIDGHAIMHRAFHALPALTSSNGELTNAVFGFFSMFLKIQEDIKPTHLAVCFDRPKPTFRKTLYAGYQAQRPSMSDDLGPQITIVHDMLSELGIQIFEIDGYEADDVIGTLAYQAVQKQGAGAAHENFLAAQGNTSDQTNLKTETPRERKENYVSFPRQDETEVIIVSGDRDLLQLVNSHVKMLSPLTGMTTMQLYDENAVIEKFGIKSKQMIDYKALVGDASDNYPGIAGIGPKTAKDLLGKYETFENIYQHLSDIPERVAAKLATDAEAGALAKKLATIVLDAPVTLKLDECSLSKFDKRKAMDIFAKKGFQSLVKRLDGNQKQQEKPQKTPKHVQQLGLL